MGRTPSKSFRGLLGIATGQYSWKRRGALMPDTLTTNEQEIKQEALTLVEQAKRVKITDQESYDLAAGLLLNQIKPFRRKWKEYWDGVREPAYRAYQAI